ncbi:MAG: very short patch repair endonuclease [Terriglobia bacterium]
MPRRKFRMKAPSFIGLKPASQAASLAKRMNRSADTVHEKLLRRVLWHRGLRFRKNLSELPGKPDIVFTKARVAVFCDGDFWHGRRWHQLSKYLQKRANAVYWCQKIRANMLRDRRTTRVLRKQHWHVIRLWEGDIRADPERAALQVENALLGRRKSEPCAS